MDATQITGVKLTKVGEGVFPNYETQINPIDDKANVPYFCQIKVMDESNLQGTSYESAVWNNSFAVFPSLIIISACALMTLLRL